MDPFLPKFWVFLYFQEKKAPSPKKKKKKKKKKKTKMGTSFFKNLPFIWAHLRPNQILVPLPGSAHTINEGVSLYVALYVKHRY